MKKYFTVAFFLFLSLFTFAQSQKNKLQFGIGSGYVFYGDDRTQDLIDMVNDPSQILLASDAAYLIKLNGPVYFDIGADLLFDARWNGGKHVYIWDYCADAGFRFYPGIAGLACTVNYCLGARTAFYELGSSVDGTDTSSWGNGYKLGVTYDFSYNSDGIAPEVGFNFRRMPRGHNNSDSIFCVYLRLKG